jgi:hypothetical protein
MVCDSIASVLNNFLNIDAFKHTFLANRQFSWSKSGSGRPRMVFWVGSSRWCESAAKALPNDLERPIRPLSDVDL